MGGATREKRSGWDRDDRGAVGSGGCGGGYGAGFPGGKGWDSDGGGGGDNEGTIFVGGLSFMCDEEAIRQHFSSIGELSNVRIITDRDTGRSKGFAFVTFANPRDAEMAMRDLQGSFLCGRNLRLSAATGKGGKGLGGFGGGLGGSCGKGGK